jgi:SP family sugar:H+ symporter-like MFS transporter
MFTEDRNIANKPNTSYVILIACSAALGGFLFGFDTAVINGAVGALQTTFNSSSAMTGFAVSSALLGSALGAFIAGPIADRLLQQFVGINVIFYYSSILWRSVGFSERNSLLITVITSVVNIVTTLIAIATVDKFGRKPLLLLGSIGMTVTLGTLAVVFGNAAIDPATGNPTLPGLPGIIALLAANLYVVFFGFSWGPIVWVMLGEMFNNKIRAAALSVAAAIQWIANFLVSTTFPPLLKSFGLGAAYGIYTIAAAISIFFVALLIKETKGKELEEM